MYKIGNEDPGVEGGALDVSRDTSIEPPSTLLDDLQARRHEADARGRRAAQRARASRARARRPVQK
jgi:hypothetical protein